MIQNGSFLLSCLFHIYWSLSFVHWQLLGRRGRGVSIETCQVGRCETLNRFHNERRREESRRKSISKKKSARWLYFISINCLFNMWTVAIVTVCNVVKEIQTITIDSFSGAFYVSIFAELMFISWCNLSF